MTKIRNLVGIESPLSKQIIISKYKEDISWVNGIKNIPYIIYDKKDKNSPHYIPNIPTFPVQRFEGIKYQKTPTGRESLTYLYHIIKHYNELADINIFLQGNPVEIHSDTRDSLIYLLQNDFKDIQFLPLNFPLVFCNNHGSPLHTGLPIERVFKRLFQGPCPAIFAYSWGAMFCVTKEMIHKRPVAFYEEMMQIIFDEPLSGYIYERLWPTILSCHDFLCHPSYQKRNRSSWGLPGLA